MRINDKYQTQRRVIRREYFPLSSGFSAGAKVVSILLYLVGLLYIYSHRDAVSAFAGSIELASPLLLAVTNHVVPAYLILGGVLLLIVWLYPFQRRVVDDQLFCIGLVNHTGLTPRLLGKRQDKQLPHITVWRFLNRGIPLTLWEDKREAIETALGIAITQMKYSKGKSQILVYAVPAKTELPELLPWDDKHLSQESFVLTLGESLTGPVAVNLAHIPHILLGGSTGSGKSVLLKLLLMQAVQKGAVVCVADFKGGVDFPPIWYQRCQLCFEETELLATLNILVSVLESRKSLFRDIGCPNLDTYIKATGDRQSRYIFACDEVAEMLDRTGRSKEDKALLSQIEARLTTIARQGRAFGVHLILATQRPDATIIPGQIRNNMDFRVCGRADNVLSQIILDNTSAADQIPKDARGRFILHDGTVFQAFLPDESCI